MLAHVRRIAAVAAIAAALVAALLVVPAARAQDPAPIGADSALAYHWWPT